MTFLTVPSIIIRPWATGLGEDWSELGCKAEAVTARAGRGEAFDALLREIQVLVDSEQFEVIDARLAERRFFRALVTLWDEDEARAKSSLSEERLAAGVRSQTPRVSRLATHALASLYLKHFDKLDEWSIGLRAAVADSLRIAVGQQKQRNSSADVVEQIRSHPQWYLDAESHRKLASHLAEDGRGLPQYFRSFGAGMLVGGRFGTLVRYEAYIELIRNADPREDHDFLYELRDRDVYGAPDEDDLKFGHRLIRELVERSAELPSDQWLDTVLAIGGDPRLRHTEAYRSWWRVLPEAIAATAIRWLSAEDLKLFLRAVEEFGNDKRIDSLQRLFPSRKKFMWGLYESGLVRETRLILGENAQGAVRRYLGMAGQRTDLSATYESEPNTAIIFLDCGDFHIVEGSHNFRLWTYMGEPDETLMDRTRRRFSRDDLIYNIPARQRSKLSAGDFDSFVHQGFWQRKPIYFLAEHGVPLDIEALLSREEYDAMKFKFHLPRVRR